MKKGITLIEILVVIAILGILSAIVIPRVGKSGLYNKHTVYTTSRQIGADMRLARRLAITTGNRHRVRFFDSDTYQIQRNSGGGWIGVGETKSIPGEIIISGPGEVQFNPNGSANAELNFIYSIDSYTYTINVKQATGRVKITEE